METKICTCCGRELPLSDFHKSKKSKDGHEGQCKQCRKEQRMKYVLVCETCGKEFKARSKDFKYCSKECSNKSKNKPKKYANCLYCGKEFVVNRKGRKYCSTKCSQEHNKIKYLKRTTEEFKNEVANVNTDIEILGDYTGVDNPIEVKCKICKHEWKPTPYNLLHGSSCPICSKPRGKNHPRYNPNLTDEEREDNRDYSEYIKWRKQVYEKDNYTCQCCGSNKSGTLTAHHKNGYNWCKERRTDITNGVTLCEDCHNEFHSIYGYGDNTEQQFEEFINNRNKEAI